MELTHAREILLEQTGFYVVEQVNDMTMREASDKINVFYFGGASKVLTVMTKCGKARRRYRWAVDVLPSGYRHGLS